MDVVFLIGRILFALAFVASGVTAHLAQARATAEYARAQGVPGPELMVPLSGVVIIVATCRWRSASTPDVGALLLAGFAFSVAVFMHAFWREQDPRCSTNQMAHFMKSLALLGGALAPFYAFNQLHGDAGLSLTNPLFDRS